MNKYKIINKYAINNPYVQIAGANISYITIGSYNISWEAMSSYGKGNFKVCVKTTDYKNGICKSNILTNIINSVKLYDPDIMGFQEAAHYIDVLNLFDKNKYDYFINNSGKEDMLTIWKKNKFKCIGKYSSEFESGRPWALLIFKNKKTHELFYFINIHAAHNPDSSDSIFKIINKYIELSIDLKFKNNISRVIMSGDYNRNIYIDNTSNYQIVIGNNKYNLNKEYDSNVTSNATSNVNINSNTCCNISGTKYGFKHNSDHTLDSKNIIFKKIIGNQQNYYLFPSSDHLLIITSLIE